jgi:1,4-alpha-glucan branching enzyme
VLHAHLPFVRHPEFERFLEEAWLFEAITETYIPLLRRFKTLADEGVPFGVTFSISPTLLAMLEDPLLQDRYRARLKELIELSEKEAVRLQHDGHFKYLAEWYRRFFLDSLEFFDAYEGRLSRALKELHESGHLEVICCGGTHGFMPQLAALPGNVQGQFENGFAYFEQVFGFAPSGMWVPECAYYPGLEETMREHGIRYFFTESEGIEHASSAPLYGLHAPLYTPAGVAAFGRDAGSTKQVWSADSGFPGDGDYREFYRDIGQELDFEYLRPYLCGDIRSDTGIKYHRITGPGMHKAGYSPEAAREKAAVHAGQFLFQRTSHIEFLDSKMSTRPVIVAPFDAELFGHWWFEGPDWLEFVIRKAAYDQDSLDVETLAAYLDRSPVHQKAYPATSSWGHKGHFEYWLNGSNDWMYDAMNACGARMVRLAETFVARKGRLPVLLDRALRQCVRELVLGQSSDWPFIVSNGTSTEYANRRVRDHVSRFHFLADAIESGEIPEKELSALEEMDNIFPKANWRCYATKS